MTIRRSAQQSDQWQYFTSTCLQLWQKTGGNASALHGLPTQRKVFSQPHWATATRPKRHENSDSKCRTSPWYWRLSALAERQLSEREVHPGWSSDQWKSWQDSWWHDEEWTSSTAVGNWWDDAKSSWKSWQDSDHWAPSLSLPSRKLDVSEPPSFPGFTANT